MVHFTELQAAARGKDPKSVKINYYGVSYGTLLGQTLVALYPDRIQRILLDGNVYGVAHYQGWEPSGIDDFAHGIWLLLSFASKRVNFAYWLKEPNLPKRSMPALTRLSKS
jgi:pimeloyl-ACP methyl ester carboxylesterase